MNLEVKESKASWENLDKDKNCLYCGKFMEEAEITCEVLTILYHFCWDCYDKIDDKVKELIERRRRKDENGSTGKTR